MASPLDNINTLHPPAALFEHGGQQLAFGRPVQTLKHDGKHLPSSDRLRIHPLPAVGEGREELFVRACQTGNEAQVQHLLSTAPGLTAYSHYREQIDQAVEKNNNGLLDLLLEFKKSDKHEHIFLLDEAIRRAVNGGHVHVLGYLLKKEESQHEWAGLRNLLHLEDAVYAGYREVVELLMQAGADINGHGGKLRATPLGFAARHGDREKVQWLLELGADPNRRAGNTGTTPLAWACFEGHLPTVEVLLEAGALVDRGENQDRTPLALAVQKGHEEVVRCLLQFGADINAAWLPTQAPLYQAVVNNRRQLLDLLLAAGAAPDLRCEQEVKETPLMVAVTQGLHLIAESLVDHGADIYRKNPEGLSVLELGEAVGSQEVVAMLRDRAARQAARPGADPQPVEP